MSLSFPSNVPLVSQAYLFKKIELENGENPQSPQVFLSAHVMKSPVLPALKVELTGVLGGVGINNMP
jgi:hypothetical protein